MRELSRVDLDAKHSDPVLHADGDPWNRLAVKFNDYVLYCYQNACVEPGLWDSLGCYVPVPGMESIADFCYDLNPCMVGRPVPMAAQALQGAQDGDDNRFCCIQTVWQPGRRDQV
jgi:hypothetical protein